MSLHRSAPIGNKLVVNLPLSVLLACLLYLFFSSELYYLKTSLNRWVERPDSTKLQIKSILLPLLKQATIIFPQPQTASVDFEGFRLRLKTKSKESTVDLSFQEQANETQTLTVSDVPSLLHTIQNAKPGQIITLTPGHYQISQRSISVQSNGRIGAPITLKANALNSVVLNLNSIEGLKISASYWIVENIHFNGVCQSDDQCEHAIHLTGNADHVSIINNKFSNFNAHIKSNGLTRKSRAARVFPDNVSIISNIFINEWPRETTSPVTPIDVVGGNNWTISHNFIADFAKTEGNQVSYGAFLKGGGRNGKITNNLVACSWKVPFSTSLDTRIGLSLGGGGTDDIVVQKPTISKSRWFEHTFGEISFNTILNCQNDVSIYLNRAAQSKIRNNIMLNSHGVKIKFGVEAITIYDNTIQGKVYLSGCQSCTLSNNQLLHTWQHFKTDK